jgi:Tol biopolymer transport system component/imidazolonepropionase-like amidohydrolase
MRIIFTEILLCLISSFIFLAISSRAQDIRPLSDKAANQLPGLTLTSTRTVRFSTDEGTWLSLDISPDGQTMIFDLVGHLYVLPVVGGEAKAITSGLSFDSQPRFSPDGKKIVYVSDRSGADNLWISNPDGSDSRALTVDKNTGFTSPSWTPDGRFILVSKKNPQFYGSGFALWIYDVRGGNGVCIIKSKPNEDASSDTWRNALGAIASPDGKYVYYASKSGYFSDDVKFPLWQIARRDLHTGEEDIITDNQGSAIRPVLSKDGTELAYGTRRDNGTALRIRNWRTGEDRWLKFPIQRDDQESYFSSRDLLPGYAFTPDGKDLLLSYGGKIHRIDVATSEDRIIPFRAEVFREIGPKLDFPMRVDEGPIHARIIQGANESPDGWQLAFSAMTHLYVMKLPAGTPKRLTSGNEREYQPSWSPDGKWLAYVTWTNEQGYLWKIAADGKSSPIQLTTVSACYSNPVWSPDGSQIILLRALREMAMMQMDQTMRPIDGLELITVPATGGTASTIAFASHYEFPHFAGSNDRIFVTESHEITPLESEYSLVSMRIDGTDRHTLLVLKGKDIWGAEFSSNVQILLSPDRREALAVYRDQLYLFDVPHIGGAAPTIDLSSPSVAVNRLTDTGADFASWAKGGKTIAWSLGSSYLRLPLLTADAGFAETPSQQDNTPAAAMRFHPQETHVDLQVARYTPKGTIVLQGAKLITMHGDEILPHGDILVRDNRIVAVGASGSFPIPAGAKIIDVTDKTIVPGFIDIHDHWFNIRRGILDTENWDFLASLAYGITTGRDPQSFTNDIFAYQDLVDAGEMIGPRAYSTGPGIFPINDFHSESEAEDVIKRYKDYYRTNTIKSYLVGNRSQREFVAEASDKLHIMPTTEGASDLTLDITHVIDGFALEHQFPIALHQDLIDLVAKSGAYYDPTFIIGYGGPPSENYYFESTEVHDNPKVRRFIPHNVIDSKTTRLTWYRKDEYAYPDLATSAAGIMDAGGKVCVGGHGEFQGLSFHWELWSLQSGGMSNLDALRAATLNGAEAIGRAQDLGSIEPGKLADLVVLDRDPLQDIQNTTSIAYVMKNGELFEGDTLKEVWPIQKQLPEMYWQEQEAQFRRLFRSDHAKGP